MRSRLEVLALAATFLAVLAFVVSTAAGLRPLQGDDVAAAPAAPVPPALPDAPAALPAVGSATRVRVEVLNGAGISGLARAATEQLRDHGFDVVYFGNAANGSAAESQVIGRTRKPADAEAVAGALGIARVRSAPDSTLMVDATVVLGKDWPPREEGGAAPAQKGSWLRRLWSRLGGG